MEKVDKFILLKTMQNKSPKKRIYRDG